MELVAQCNHAPGEAVGRGGASDVIDTGIDIAYFSGRLYLHPKDAREAGVAAGLVDPDEHAKVEAERDRLIDELATAVIENHGLKAAVEEAESLRHALAYTLERGVVVDKRNMTIGLRHKPGQKRLDVERSLWQPYVEAVESPHPGNDSVPAQATTAA